MNKTELLKNFGLSKQESSVYLSLLGKGPQIISQLCRDVKMHRPTAYQAIEGLLKRSLVSTSTKGKQKFYVAENPEKLEFIFESFKEDFENLKPEFEALYKSQGKRPVVKFFEGSMGVTAVVEDTVQATKRGDIVYRYSSKHVTDQIQKYLPKNFRLRRDFKDIQRVVITDELTEHQKRGSLNTNYVLLPKGSEVLGNDIIYAIYGNRVAFGDVKNKASVIIESESFAKLQRNIFKVLYKYLDSRLHK